MGVRWGSVRSPLGFLGSLGSPLGVLGTSRGPRVELQGLLVGLLVALGGSLGALLGHPVASLAVFGCPWGPCGGGVLGVHSTSNASRCNNHE